jgi:hypothetical protein
MEQRLMELSGAPEYICIYDVESTGKGPRDEVVQLAYLIVKIKDLKIVGGRNFYCMSTVPFHAKASAVNKLNTKLVAELSGGKFIEELIIDDPYFMGNSNILFTSYNATFDNRLMNQSLGRNTDLYIKFGDLVSKPSSAKGRAHFCSANFAAAATGRGHTIRLSQIYNELVPSSRENKMEEVTAYTSYISRELGLSSGTLRAHDALFDCVMLWRLLGTLKKSWW